MGKIKWGEGPFLKILHQNPKPGDTVMVSNGCPECTYGQGFQVEWNKGNCQTGGHANGHCSIGSVAHAGPK